MSKIDEFRAKYPGVYDDLSDAEIAQGLYEKSYSDMDRGEFDAAMGLAPTGGAGRAFQSVDDSMRIAADSMTMGGADKVLGAEDRAMTEASRDRQGWGGTAVDVGAGMINPFKVASKTASGLWGAGAGALDAYGHQEDWIPGWEDWKDIGVGAAVGGASGVAGAKGGEMIGGLLDRMKLKKAKEGERFKSSDDLMTEAQRRQDMGYEKFAEDFRARGERVKRVEEAQGQPRGELDTMLKGMDLSDAERAAAAAATEAPGMIKRGVTKAGKAVTAAEKYFPKTFQGPAIAAEIFLGGGIPWTTGAGLLTAKGLQAAGRKFDKPSKADVEALLSTMRDPGGKGYRVDDVGRNSARDLLAKFGVSAGRQVNR